MNPEGPGIIPFLIPCLSLQQDKAPHGFKHWVYLSSCNLRRSTRLWVAPCCEAAVFGVSWKRQVHMKQNLTIYVLLEYPA